MLHAPHSVATHTDYQPVGYFILRAPLLPIENWSTLSNDLSLSNVNTREQSILAKAIDNDKALLHDRLKHIVQDPIVSTALYIASPNLSNAIDLWLKNGDAKRVEKLQHKLIQYVARMTMRPTPYGLFASTSLGCIDQASNLRLPEDSYHTLTRIDAAFLCMLIEQIKTIPAVHESSLYFPNPTIYRKGALFKYISVEPNMGVGLRNYEVTAVEATYYLKHVLDCASNGVAFIDLVQSLMQLEVDISMEEAEDFIKELIENRLLLSHIDLNISGTEPLQDLLLKLSNASKDQALAIHSELFTIQQQLQAIDQSPLHQRADVYRSIASRVNTLLLSCASDTKIEMVNNEELHHTYPPFHTDLIRNTTDLRLSESMLNDVLAGVKALHSITPTPQSEILHRFKEEFIKRYQSREVALLEALDEETGIQFNQEDGFEFEGWFSGLPYIQTALEDNQRFGFREKFLLNKIITAQKKGSVCIELSQDDISRLQVQNQSPLSPLISASIVLSDTITNSREPAGSILLNGTLGPSGAELFGRFCHADKNISQSVKSHLELEEKLYANAILAEVVYLPQNKIGNVICRPRLRDYEIPFFAGTSTESNKQIALSDLFISIRGDRILLRSHKLNREIIPRLTSAHHAINAELNLYRFLFALQYQDCAWPLNWQWGALETLPFLPRVKYKNVVLCRAQWNLDQDDVADLAKSKALKQFNGVKLITSIRDLKTQHNLPRHIGIVDGDMILPLDLDNILCCEILAQHALNKANLRLTELWPPFEQQCVQSGDNHFAHEIIVPFVNAAKLDVPCYQHFADYGSLLHAKQRFSPLGEWCYLKLYGRTKNLENALTSSLLPLLDELLEKRLIDRWFFLRYEDPDFHLRIRLHVGSDASRSTIYALLNKKIEELMVAELVTRIQFDTYEPEIERYGGAYAIEMVENFFSADSAMAARLITAQKSSTAREAIAIASTHFLLSKFESSPQACITLLQQTSSLLQRDFQFDKSFYIGIGQKYRDISNSLEQVLSGNFSEFVSDIDFNNAWLNWLAQIDLLSARFESLAKREELTRTVSAILRDLIHMNINRLIAIRPRVFELIVCEVLVRYYRMCLNRNKSERAS